MKSISATIRKPGSRGVLSGTVGKRASCPVSSRPGGAVSSATPLPKRVLVGLWMGGVFGQDVMDGIHDWLRESGTSWRIRFADSGSLFSSSLDWMVAEHALDGVITYYRGDLSLSTLRRAGIPYITFDEYGGDASDSSGERASRPSEKRTGGMPLPPPFASVDLDLPALAREAVGHFLSRADFRSAAYVENYFDHGWSRHRGDAIMDEFTRKGLIPSRFFHYGRPSSLGSKTGPDFAGLAAWLRGLEKPCALVAANDATAADVIRLCEAEGIVVPRDVAVLGIDDNPVFCRHTEPNLSSLRLDGRRAGANAARALAALMDGATAPDPAALRFGVSVSRRASTAATPSIGEIVQRAIDFIDANACRGATLGDVVRHCGYSRTLVALRFRQMTGRSIARAIRERRLNEARRLLRESSMGIEEIAPLCGYESASALHRAFSRETGTTMGAWRRTVAAPQSPAKSRENHSTSP